MRLNKHKDEERELLIICAVVSCIFSASIVCSLCVVVIAAEGSSMDAGNDIFASVAR